MRVCARCAAHMLATEFRCRACGGSVTEALREGTETRTRDPFSEEQQPSGVRRTGIVNESNRQIEPEEEVKG